MNINQDISGMLRNRANLQSRLGQADSLKDKSEEGFNKRLKDACDGFEELFVHKMLQVMRESSQKGNLLFGGRGEEIFQDMLDENYAKLITKSGSLGLSREIYEHTKKNT